MDISSNNSGFMSRNTKKRSIRRGDGKRSVSMAIKNETLINKIQEQVAEHKLHCQQEFARVDSSIETSIASLETRVTEF